MVELLEALLADRVLNGRDLAALDHFVAEDFVELDPFPGQGKGRERARSGALSSTGLGTGDCRWRGDGPTRDIVNGVTDEQ